MYTTLVTELCVLRTFGGVDFSLIFICAQYVPEFLWDRLRASIQFPVMPKRAQYARFSGESDEIEIQLKVSRNTDGALAGWRAGSDLYGGLAVICTGGWQRSVRATCWRTHDG